MNFLCWLLGHRWERIYNLPTQKHEYMCRRCMVMEYATNDPRRGSRP